MSSVNTNQYEVYYKAIWYLVFLTTISLELLIWTGPAKDVSYLCIYNDCMRVSFNPIFSLFSSLIFLFSHFHEIDGCGSHEYDAWPRPTKLIFYPFMMRIWKMVIVLVMLVRINGCWLQCRRPGRCHRVTILMSTSGSAGWLNNLPGIFSGCIWD